MIKSEIPAHRILTALHGLRGLAAMAVAVFHLHHLIGLALPFPLQFIATHWGLGVQLFFVLSAFSLCYSTINSVGREGWVRDYLIKRYFRIAPMFYFMLLAWVTLFILRGVNFEFSNILLNILMVYNFVPGKHESIVQAGWTIGVEMLFYLLLPLLLITIHGLWKSVIFAALALLISVVVRAQLVAAGGVLQSYAHFAFLSSLGIFALGMVSFNLYQWGIDSSYAVRLRLIFSMAAVSLILFVALASDQFDYFIGMASRPDILLWSLLFAALISWQALAPSRVLAATLFEFAGERSFSIYLVHPMVILFLAPANRGLYAVIEPISGAWAFIPCAFMTLSVVILASIITYRLIEVPGIHFGRLLIARCRIDVKVQRSGVVGNL